MSKPIADVSVRPAIPGDEAVIADVQLAAWRQALGEDIAAVIPREPIEASWRASISSPPSREHRVFAATDGPRVVGFAAVAPGGELVALEVAPDHRRKGHGARLLAACVDSMRTAGAPHMKAWALESDRPRQAFFESAGLAPGGVERVLEGPEGGIPETLWRAEI
jgi:GNAT superfamily N-acetyltransferase